MPELEQLPSTAPRPETNGMKTVGERSFVAMYLSPSMISPELFHLFPNCTRAACNKPLKGQVVLVTGRMFHVACVPDGTRVVGVPE